jgi:hypothetical protein
MERARDRSSGLGPRDIATEAACGRRLIDDARDDTNNGDAAFGAKEKLESWPGDIVEERNSQSEWKAEVNSPLKGAPSISSAKTEAVRLMWKEVRAESAREFISRSAVCRSCNDTGDNLN